MFVLIERYINNMSIHDLNNLAISKGIGLSKDELEFSYNYIKKNWKNVLSNYRLFDFDKYKDKYSDENFIKIKKLIKEYTLKYGSYLK
jgi:hypothetical protein